MVLERPKVLHNHQTGKFVMWMHIDDAQYGWARVGVAVSDSPLGPFSYERSFRPHDQESRDFTVWQVLQYASFAYHIGFWNQVLALAVMHHQLDYGTAPAPIVYGD